MSEFPTDTRLLSADDLARLKTRSDSTVGYQGDGLTGQECDFLFDHIAALTDQLAAQAQPSEQVRLSCATIETALLLLENLPPSIVRDSVMLELRAAQAQPSELVRELVAACQQLLGDEDECYEPGKCLVTADAMKRIRAALAPSTETSDAQ